MVNRALGRRPPKNAPALRLASYLTGVVPAHPAAADHFAEVSDWGLYGNNAYSDCGPTGVANQRKLITRYLGSAEVSPTQDDVFDLYRRSGNPGFDPNDPEGPGDQGVDMQTMCEALVSGGIGGVKALGFAQVDHTNLDELQAAIAIFGSLLLGVNLENAQQSQTDAHLWDYKRSAEWGGHAVLCGRYATFPPIEVSGYPHATATYKAPASVDRTAAVTWAEVVDMTDAFLDHQLDEAWVVIWPEHLGSRVFLEGVDLLALAADYFTLTGRPFPGAVPVPAPAPVPVPPQPSPQPVDVADEALAAAAHQWLTHRHVGANGALAKQLQSWLDSKSL